MNTASQDLPRHLGALREKLQHATDYEDALTYFLQEFAGDEAFIKQSTPTDVPHLEAAVRVIAGKVFPSGTAAPGPARISTLADLGFYHGNAALADCVALLFYFEDIDLGLVAFLLGAGPTNQVGRFRLGRGLVRPPTN